MRSLLLVLALFPALASAAEDLAKSRNLAYEDDFVWYVATRLAHELTAFHSRSGIKRSDEEMSEQRAQFEILYHHYLVECKGPLPKLAESLSFFDVSAPGSPTSVLAYAGHMESTIWPIVRDWNGSILLQLLDTYSKGTYGFFPACVTPGFKDQNPTLGTATP